MGDDSHDRFDEMERGVAPRRTGKGSRWLVGEHGS